MKVYNIRLDAVLDIIKISQLNAKEFEEVTGLTRSRLYSWRSGKVKNINTGTAEGVAGKLGYTLSISENWIRACEIDENQDTFVDRPIKPELEALKKIITIFSKNIRNWAKSIINRIRKWNLPGFFQVVYIIIFYKGKPAES